MIRHRSATALATAAIALACASAEPDEKAAPPGAPEIIKVMDLDGLEVANRPGIENTYKYIREPNAIVTKDGTLVVVAGMDSVLPPDRRGQVRLTNRQSRFAPSTESLPIFTIQGSCIVGVPPPRSANSVSCLCPKTQFR